MSIVRRPSPRDLPCPDCRAEAEDPCVNAAGQRMKSSHSGRAEAARAAGGKQW